MQVTGRAGITFPDTRKRRCHNLDVQANYPICGDVWMKLACVEFV